MIPRMYLGGFPGIPVETLSELFWLAAGTPDYQWHKYVEKWKDGRIVYNNANTHYIACTCLN